MSDEEIIIENEDENLQDKIKKLKEELEKCRKEKEEYLAGWQRAKADFINSRKEEEKRRLDFIKFANESLVLEFLIVLDGFDLALSSIENEYKSCKCPEKLEKTLRGFYLLKSQMDDILKKYGLKPIKAVGERFNPEFHEAVAEIESPDKEKGTVLDELQKGYLLHDKVLRASKVRIVK